MRQLSAWWLFFIGFAVMIGAIHGLRWCVTSANAAPASQVVAESTDVAAAKRHVSGVPQHWRSMLLQQQ